jgi:hypothetical protein
MLRQMKIRLFAAALILIALSAGCGGKRDPLFQVQNAPAAPGQKQTLKEAFGRYRYFRSAGWNVLTKTEGTDIVVTARLDLQRMLSALKDRAQTDQERERITRCASQDEQYFVMTAYDFAFRANADNTVTYTGVTIIESDGNNRLTTPATAEEQAQMLRNVSENVFPAWVERSLKVKCP